MTNPVKIEEIPIVLKVFSLKLLISAKRFLKNLGEIKGKIPSKIKTSPSVSKNNFMQLVYHKKVKYIKLVRSQMLDFGF